MRRRVSYLINTRVQLSIAFLMLTFVLIGHLIYPIIFYNLFKSTDTILQEHPQLYQQIVQSNIKNIYLLIFWIIAISAIAFVVAILLGHKIVGPLFKIDKTISQSITDQKIYPIELRSNDHFKELADTINQLTSTLQSNIDGVKKLQQLIQASNSLSAEELVEIDKIISTIKM